MQVTKGLVKAKRVGLLISTAVFAVSTVQAALPPQHQNANDLNALLSYVKASPAIMSQLQAIDLISKTVFYGDGCTAVFERLVIEKPEGWVGPADPLVIKKDSCPSFDDMEPLSHDDMEETDDIGGITMRETDACTVEAIEESCTP